MGTVLAVLLLAWSSGGPQPEKPSLNLDPLALSGEMEQFVESVVDPHAPAMRKLEQLVAKVFQENALGFTYEPETRTAIETFEKRSGDCLSFTNMFVAMSRHAGLDVRFREVEVIPTWTQKGRVFVVSQHVNVSIHLGATVYAVDLFPRIDRFEIGGRVISDGRALAHFYNNKGAEWLAAGLPEQAATSFEEALRCAPEASFVWANMGVAQTHQGVMGEAEESYLRALELDPHNLVALSNLAELYLRTGRSNRASDLDKKVESFRKRNPYYHFKLGREAYEAGDYSLSVRHLRAAIKRKPKEHRFHWALAQAYARLGKLKKVQKSLKRAQQNAPDESGKVRYTEKLEQLAANLPTDPQRP